MKTVLVLLLAIAGVLSLPITPRDDEEPLWQRSGKFEGDMVLSPAQRRAIIERKGNTGRNGLIDATTRWPGKVIPYKFDSKVDAAVRATIRAALDEYNKRTCITVREATREDADYVLVTSDNSGCWSYVGRSGGIQELNLQHSSSGTCLSTGTIQHEFLHAAGFFHQQSASDRDEFVTIEWENIRAGTEGNFVKYPDSYITDFGVPYDYSSVMHYSGTAFSTNGKATIVPKDPKAVIGQRAGFSDADILKLERMYGCK